MVHFDGELGVDCGALTREWAKIMCQQLLRPGRGLFRRTARGNRVVFLADQESELAHGETTEGIYCFLGRFIAFALWRGIRIDAVFTPFLFRLMMNPKVRFSTNWRIPAGHLTTSALRLTFDHLSFTLDI